MHGYIIQIEINISFILSVIGIRKYILNSESEHHYSLYHWAQILNCQQVWPTVTSLFNLFIYFLKRAYKILETPSCGSTDFY